MAIVLLVKPAGLFGRAPVMDDRGHGDAPRSPPRRCRRVRSPDRRVRRDGRPSSRVAPFVVYPVFLMKALCFALFACAFNLLIGYGGLLSFGHAAFLGSAGYVTAHAAKVWGLPPELAILAGTAAGRRARPRRRGPGHPPPGHLLRDDHAGAGADGLLLLPAGAVHRRRGRHPGGAARHAPRRARPAPAPARMYFVVLAIFLARLPAHLPHHPLALRPGAQGDPRERAARDLARLPAPSTTS